MGEIRTATKEDMRSVAQLHLQEKRSDKPVSKNDILAMTNYLTNLFFNNPWMDERTPSLISHNENEVIGFLGVLPRHWKYKDKDILGAVGNHFMVKESERKTMLGARLLKQFFSNKQDLIVSEGNQKSLKIWQAGGGVVSNLYSIHWTTLLSPLAYLSASFPGFYNLAGLLDKPITGTSKSPFFVGSPELEESVLSAEEMLKYITLAAKKKSLKPVYTIESLKWILEIIKSKKHGVFYKTLLKNEKGRVAGWYLYYLKPNGTSRVIHMVATRGMHQAVFQHLLYKAKKGGSLALTGRIEPEFLPTIQSYFTLFSRDHSWTLLHSSNSLLLDAIEKSDAFFTQLEGEQWLAFR